MSSCGFNWQMTIIRLTNKGLRNHKETRTLLPRLNSTSLTSYVLKGNVEIYVVSKVQFAH